MFLPVSFEFSHERPRADTLRVTTRSAQAGARTYCGPGLTASSPN